MGFPKRDWILLISAEGQVQVCCSVTKEARQGVEEAIDGPLNRNVIGNPWLSTTVNAIADALVHAQDKAEERK